MIEKFVHYLTWGLRPRRAQHYLRAHSKGFFVFYVLMWAVNIATWKRQVAWQARQLDRFSNWAFGSMVKKEEERLKTMFGEDYIPVNPDTPVTYYGGRRDGETTTFQEDSRTQSHVPEK